MSTKTFRGQSATFTISQGGTDIPVGVIDDPEVAPTKDIAELRGAGSTEWQDLQKTSTSVDVSGTVMAFAEDAWEILNNYDSAGGQLDDSADVRVFEWVVTYTAADGTTKDITVTDCYNEGTPLGGSRDEWIGMDIEMTGRTVSDVTNTAP